MVENLEGHVLEDWAMSRTSSGVPFYVNHNRGVTQWDHPEYVRIFEEIQSINSVKYAAYRTACKLRRLQTKLKLHDVPLQCVASAFDTSGLRAGENNDLVEVKQVEQIILKMLRTTYNHRHVHVALATQLTVNLILNIYDLGRNGMVQVLGCKVLLVVMCGGRLQEKYRYLFSQVADHNNCCTRRKLGALLRNLARIPELLSEQPSFGLSLVAAAVESCFKEVSGEVGIGEEVLLGWLLREPQTLVWWTTLYRLTAAELVCHDVKCGVCKQRPVIGLRYQCLRCLGYNLCQDCFLHARTSRSHKLSHPIQEYCHETNSKEWRRALMKILKYRLRGGGGSGNKQRYLAIPTSQDPNGEGSDGGSRAGACVSWSESSEDEGQDDDNDEHELFSRTILNTSQDSHCMGGDNREGRGEGGMVAKRACEPTILPTSPRHQIHSVIMHLQEGHRQLEEEGSTIGVSGQVVEQHIQQLQTQINKLKAILQDFQPRSNPVVMRTESEGHKGVGGVAAMRGLARLESTPIVGERGLLLNLSPITSRPSPDDTAVLDNKENHLVENPGGSPFKPCGTVESLRMPFTPCQKNTAAPSDPRTHTTPIVDPNWPKLASHGSRLPSFTEVNFSDLTSVGSSASLAGSSPPKEFPVKKSANSTAADVKEELENILRQLDQMFPLTGSESESLVGAEGGGVVEAACELGDALADYVGAVPKQPD
ncbi:hypothetical protein Pcinc_021386 [Petrolisthes cinctipes]|uniref:Dystrophin n=1 Tax=Petrolisthes cinctipes TaxID=88211 RepID=A0AAE1FI10_PETCI|nr:hypothetical protein Pcinc_021386 [Petrolisthes cinctipes]